MYNNWRVDLSDSVKALESIKQTYLPKVIAGTIHTIEQSDNAILMKIDQFSGIDYIREDNTGLQGIAARVQWGRSWDTFTIRSKRHSGAETELSKRLRQIDDGYFYPAFTLQAYFDNRQKNNLLSLAVIKTKTLYRLFNDEKQLFEKRRSDNEFYFIRWAKIEEHIKKVAP